MIDLKYVLRKRALRGELMGQKYGHQDVIACERCDNSTSCSLLNPYRCQNNFVPTYDSNFLAKEQKIPEGISFPEYAYAAAAYPTTFA